MSSGNTSTSSEVDTISQDRSERRSLLQTFNRGGRVFWGRMIVGVLFLLPLVGVFAGLMLYQTMEQVSQLKVEDPALVSHIIYQLRAIGFLFLSVIILLCLLGIYFIFFLAVRVYGPQVALIRFIDQLKAGRYEPYRRLRRDDQLKEIWQGLQELAETLRRKHG